jgi:hypothetical protein
VCSPCHHMHPRSATQLQANRAGHITTCVLVASRVTRALGPLTALLALRGPAFSTSPSTSTLPFLS